jgi:gliding motility-associated-like protein
VISIANDQDVNCIINSNAIQLFACPPANDNCNGAEEAIVNTDESCTMLNPGTITAASASPDSSSCIGDDDDVWFEFTALSEVQLISLINISGTTTNLGHGLYEGECGELTELYCSADNSSVTTALTIGNNYFVKVFSSGTNSENVDFDLCIKDAPDNTVCENAANFCGQGGALYGSNIFDYPSLGQIACLYSTPNPSWNIIQIGDSGTIDIQIVQNTEFDENGNPTGNGLDVDFVLWGPFDSEQNFCADEVLDQGCPDPADCPNNTTNPNFYPSGNIIDCSYSANNVENLTIDNALSGEIYVLLVTNYSNNAGTIQIEQTNAGSDGAGSTVAEIEVSLGEDIELCDSTSYELNADSTFADSYEWYLDGEYLESENNSTLSVNESGIYTVVVYDNQCDSFADDSVFVNFYELPVASFENDTYEVCPNATIPVEIKLIPEFDDTTVSYDISWTYNNDFFANENSLTLGVINAGNYEYTLTNSQTGCSYSDSINITELETCVIPQGISPNGDGYNDDFDLSSYNVSSLKVFNRWGILMYSKTNYLNEWRGQSNDGKLLPVGTYFYVMNYEENKTKVDWVYLNY